MQNLNPPRSSSYWQKMKLKNSVPIRLWILIFTLFGRISPLKYVVKKMLKMEDNKKLLLNLVLQRSIGYGSLKEVCECLLYISVSTAGMERSFGTMNRILNQLSNLFRRWKPEWYSVLVSIGEPQMLSDDQINAVIGKYLCQKKTKTHSTYIVPIWKH